MKDKEIRILKAECSLKVEERADGEDIGPKITGYAAVFNSMSEDLGGFREKIKPGAFKRALAKSDVRGLFNHDSNFILGRQSSGTLKLKEDKHGLHMEITPPDTQIIRDLVLSPIKRGDIKEQSFGFIVKEDKWDGIDDEKKEVVRTILEIDELFDVSPVTFPAYPDTSVALRRRDQAEAPAFSVASFRDKLNAAVARYNEAAESGEDESEEIVAIIEILIPSLNEQQVEQITNLIPTEEPDGQTAGDNEGNNEVDEELTQEATTELRKEVLDRCKKLRQELDL